MDKDLIVAVGGDGTILNTSSSLDDTIPLLGINSDPRRPEVIFNYIKCISIRNTYSLFA